VTPTPWWQQPMMPFDLETTGVDVQQDRIVSGFVGTLLPGTQRWAIQVGARVLVDPGIEIPAGATAVHGITTERVREHGCDAVTGVNSVAEALTQGLKAGFPIVGFNLAYDLSLLHWECIRNGLQTVDERLGFKLGPVVDAHVLDKQVDQYRKGSRKLEPTCAYWGVQLDQAHNAEADAIGATRLAYRLAKRHPLEIGDLPVNVLHDRQVHWRAVQANGLQRHFRKTRPDAVVDPCWPVCYGHPEA